MGLYLHMYIQQSTSHVWVSTSLWASRSLCGPWISPTRSPLHNGLFPSGLHMSTPHIFYPPWEPRTSSLSSTIGNNTHLLGLFQDHLCGFYEIAWCNIPSPLQLWKEPRWSWHLCPTPPLALIPLVGSRIILPQILAIQNNNYTKEHKYLCGKLFLLEGKTTGQTPNNFTIIKSITIILVYVSWLNKNFSCFSLLSHTNYLSQKRQHFALSFLFSSPRTALSWLSSFSLNSSLLATLSSFSFLCGFLFLYSCTYSLYVFSKALVPYSLLFLTFLPSENPFFLSLFHTLFSLSP